MQAQGQVAGVDALVAAYKQLLRDLLDRRPSGTRQKIALALGKHKSFVSQIANPAYATPVPAKHLRTIFELCHVSTEERQEFLRAYAAAHPRRALSLVEPARGDVESITIEVPVLGDTRRQALLVETIRRLAREAITLAHGAEPTSDSMGAISDSQRALSESMRAFSVPARPPHSETDRKRHDEARRPEGSSRRNKP